MQARIPIQFQLNVKQWEKELVGYWDGKLLELIRYGFPMNLNRACDLGQYTGNNSSANDFPKDVEAYLDEEWPYGIDKTSYLNSAFDLTFPTVNDITFELKCLCRGALLYQVDVSRAFCHVKVDPRDYDLLGLHWKGYYVDSCVPSWESDFSIPQ